MNCVDKYPGVHPVKHSNDITAHYMAASAVPFELETRDRISLHLLCGRQNSGLQL